MEVTSHSNLTLKLTAVGQWRAKATYKGSRTSSPSAVGFSYLLVSQS